MNIVVLNALKYIISDICFMTDMARDSQDRCSPEQSSNWIEDEGPGGVLIWPGHLLH